MPINRTGAVATGTRQNLIQGLRAKPMPVAAVDAVLNQAAQFTEQLINIYSTEIAAGEVGLNGTGQASEAAILSASAPTVLLYGRVQSGKTAAMVLTSALCLDNGFRIIVVLTADNVALVKQTADRFKDLHGPRVFSSFKDDAYEWEGQEEEIRREIATDGLILVCAKDAFHLPQIITFLRQVSAPAYPTIILDDEADAATPDTTIAARSTGRANAPLQPSTIHRRVIENQMPGEESQSIAELFPHRLYVQVTATPFILFLQRSTSHIRPKKTLLLEAGDGYCGGEVFFGDFDPEAEPPPALPLVLLPPNEAQAINLLRVPAGLAASIEFFLLACVAKAGLDGRWPREGFKHLSHPSHRIALHTIVAGHIQSHISEIRRELSANPTAAQRRFAPAYEELRRTNSSLQPLDQLIIQLQGAIRQVQIVRVNSETDVPNYGPRLNFLVGGNILGRGLTIDDLLVTYYVREAQISQMDTIWQHARMYGYRNALMPYTRVYLPHRVAVRFKGIHEAEEELRALLRREAEGETVLVRIAVGTRPTRPNAVEPDALQVIGPGLEQLFPRYIQLDATAAAVVRSKLIVANVPIDLADRRRRATPVPISTVLDIVSSIPMRDNDPGRWQPETISALLESFGEQHQGNIVVYVRGLEQRPPPSGSGWMRGRLSGEEIGIIRSASVDVPALAMMYLGSEVSPEGWYPTLVLPENMPTYIVNTV